MDAKIANVILDSENAHMLVLENEFMLLEGDSYRWPKGLLKASAGSVSPIGDLLSHTAKSKFDKAYEQVMDTLREIDLEWHKEDE